MKKLMKRAITAGTARCINYMRDEKLELPDYISHMTQSGYEIICEVHKLSFLSEITNEAEILLEKHDVRFSDYVKIVIQDDEQYKSAFTASGMIIYKVDQWMESSDEKIAELLAYIIYVVLLAREYIENKKFAGIWIFTRQKQKSNELWGLAQTIAAEASQPLQEVSTDFFWSVE